MDMTKTEETILLIISNSGSARSHVFEALREARKGNFKDVKSLLDSADEELKNAHSIQTTLLQQEAAGNNNEVSLLMVHAQDHLMTSMLARDFADEIVHLNGEIYEVKKILVSFEK